MNIYNENNSLQEISNMLDLNYLKDFLLRIYAFMSVFIIYFNTNIHTYIDL